LLGFTILNFDLCDLQKEKWKISITYFWAGFWEGFTILNFDLCDLQKEKWKISITYFWAGFWEKF
jgi:hypothetical protein